MRQIALVLTFLSIFGSLWSEEDPIPAIERRLPPTGGIKLPDEVRKDLKERVEKLKESVWEIDFKEHVADAGALVKAVDFALQHNEFYSEKEIPLAGEMLDLAESRIREMDENDAQPWTDQKGLIVRGFQSEIDDSYQPYGLEIPEGLDLSKPVPLLVWLHGRGDKVTDLHFLKRCMSRSQALGGFVKDQEEVIIVHPFGRQCVGWKHAGEIDVFEAIAAVREDYSIDPDRIALAGFSMGGAGAWHIGAHYTDQFCLVHAGAGFAETKEYNKLTPEDFPPEVVQVLWQVYDVPNYIRNFLNNPPVAYSGAEDKQKQASDLVARELKKVGHELHHVIGEGMGHKYNQESVDEIWAELQGAWKRGRKRPAGKIQWQTPTLRYPGYDWLQLTGLEQHWKGATAAASWDREKGEVSLDLKNVSALKLQSGAGNDLSGTLVRINGVALEPDDPGFPVEAVSLVKRGDSWTWGEPGKLAKRPGIQGPIDDAFLSRFIVVPPDRKPNSPKFARWLDFELNHFRSRWKALMRGELIEKSAEELDSEDIRDANLILWGDPASNAMIAEIADRLPFEWPASAGGGDAKGSEEVRVFIYPNPLNRDRYVVINSGLTFREGHDRTNSLQNPKLPDWAIIGLDQDPDENSPGRIVDSGFFNEQWK